MKTTLAGDDDKEVSASSLCGWHCQSLQTTRGSGTCIGKKCMHDKEETHNSQQTNMYRILKNIIACEHQVQKEVISSSCHGGNILRNVVSIAPFNIQINLSVFMRLWCKLRWDKESNTLN